jgi:hypothetical protein
MKLVYGDVDFTLIIEFLSWVGVKNKMIWYGEGEHIDGSRIFLMDLSDPFQPSNHQYDLVLLDAAVYPDWKSIQEKFPEYSTYEQLLEHVKFYNSEFGFDMTLLLDILQKKKSRKKFEAILRKYKK